MNILIFGLSITSSWGNGHAITYRGLVKELHRRGHSIVFLECDQPWYAGHRDFVDSPHCQIELYRDTAEAKTRFATAVREADCVIVGSYVPDGIDVGRWVTANAGGITAFYDIDTPITLAAIEAEQCEYLSEGLLRRYDLYLSFTGGPLLERISDRYQANAVHPLYCSVDPEDYFPESGEIQWDLGYLGTYSKNRQPKLDAMLITPARMTDFRFVVAGPQYPSTLDWPRNVERIEHLDPRKHRKFYNAQRYTLNLTRREMVRAGYSPSVRLFEAAACGVPIISDPWDGIDTFFIPGDEILLAETETAEEVVAILRRLPESERVAIGQRARNRILRRHTAAHRAEELERLILRQPEKPSDLERQPLEILA